MAASTLIILCLVAIIGSFAILSAVPSALAIVVAPLAFGAISLVLPLATTFLAVALIGTGAALAAVPVRRLESSLPTSTEQAEWRSPEDT